MSSNPKILLVDDDVQALDSTRKILELAGYELATASDGQAALELIRSQAGAPVDLIVTDVRMPRLGGLEFLRALSLCGNTTPVILMTAFGRVEDAVWAMKLGAVDFLTKPFKRHALLTGVENALKRSKARVRAGRGAAERTEVPTAQDGGMVGRSPGVARLRDLLRQVAPTAATVLITGESGTGKELVARCVHEQSVRANGRLIALNCAAFPEQLMESELFGFEKGAFTGATAAKEGLFEAAHGGTLFLDEIGEMPLSLQAKLLRILQDGEVRRIGSNQSRKVDVRLVAATNRNLHEAVRAGTFRQDLLYRLEVIAIEVPPLRARMEDVPELAYHFLRLNGRRHEKEVSGIGDSAMEILLSHAWPGNVRELSNVIERAIVFAQGPIVEAADLPPHLSAVSGSAGLDAAGATGSISIPLGTPLKDVEELLIRKTLEATDGDKNMTAKLLGINSRTIYRKLDPKKAET